MMQDNGRDGQDVPHIMKYDKDAHETLKTLQLIGFRLFFLLQKLFTMQCVTGGCYCFNWQSESIISKKSSLKLVETPLYLPWYSNNSNNNNNTNTNTIIITITITIMFRELLHSYWIFVELHRLWNPCCCVLL